MKKIILIFGTIAGLICIALFYAKVPGDGQFNFEEDMSQVYGYISMAIALSSIFFATKQYRDKYNDGVIKFGKAFLIGLGITAVAALFYVVAWEIYFSKFGEGFVEQYIAFQTEQLVESGLTAAEATAKYAPEAEMMESYKTNTLMRIGFTTIEIFPVGLLISLISALLFGVILKKDQV